MYMLLVLFGFAAVFLMFCGSRHEGNLRARHYGKLFHARLMKQEPGRAISGAQLRHSHYIIGRRRRKSDLVVEDDKMVSRVHATLAYKGNRFFVAPIFHPARFFKKSYYSQVMLNGEPVPPEGRMVEFGDDIRVGNTHLYLEESEPESVPFRPTFLIPLFTTLFILVLNAFVRRGAAAVELALPSFNTATALVLGFLLVGSVWALVSGTPALSFISAVSVLLMTHNSYMVFFEKEANYLIYMVVFVVVFAVAFLVLRQQAWLTSADGLFWLLAAAVVGLMILNLLFGKGSKESDARLWLRIGGLSIQPGEIIKPMLALLGAMCYRRPKRFWIYFTATAFVCASLVFLRDFGNVCVIFSLLLLMIYLIHDNITVSVLTIVLSVAGFLVLIGTVPYAAERLAGWGQAMTNPNSFQQKQIITSVLFGGFTGLGFEDYKWATDIFAAASDSALAGIQAVFGAPLLCIALAAYACIVYQASANSSVYPMGNLLLVQSALVIFLQVLLNYAGSTDVLFFTGVTAPLISAGGSAMVSNGIFMAMIAASLCPAIKRAQ